MSCAFALLIAWARFSSFFMVDFTIFVMYFKVAILVLFFGYFIILFSSLLFCVSI